jgi:acetylornithine aminotransferase
MVGIQLTDGNQLQQVLSEARAQGLLVLSAGKDVVRLLPPLVMTKAQLADGVAILEEVL